MVYGGQKHGENHVKSLKIKVEIPWRSLETLTCIYVPLEYAKTEYKAFYCQKDHFCSFLAIFGYFLSILAQKWENLEKRRNYSKMRGKIENPLWRRYKHHLGPHFPKVWCAESHWSKKICVFTPITQNLAKSAPCGKFVHKTRFCHFLHFTGRVASGGAPHPGNFILNASVMF